MRAFRVCRYLGTAALAIEMTVLGSAQSGKVTQPGSTLLNSGKAASSSGTVQEVLREIDDPHTGDRWLLERDPHRPAGPGRMVLAAAADQTSTRNGIQVGSDSLAREAKFPVIRGGDRVIVEEHSQVVDARLEATALGDAPVGSFLQVRLAVGGKVVRTRAIAPGRALLVHKEGQR